jgi:glycosyltransferase involved in cell wall biosynthesis
MATGLPVIATRVGGNSELIESAMTGTLVSPANSDALADAILAYFHDRMTARRHAKAAYRAVEARSVSSGWYWTTPASTNAS